MSSNFSASYINILCIKFHSDLTCLCMIYMDTYLLQWQGKCPFDLHFARENIYQYLLSHGIFGFQCCHWQPVGHHLRTSPRSSNIAVCMPSEEMVNCCLDILGSVQDFACFLWHNIQAVLPCCTYHCNK